MAQKKPKCEIKTIICNEFAVRKMTGKKSTDPKFNCCESCKIYLKRGGVVLKDVVTS